MNNLAPRKVVQGPAPEQLFVVPNYSLGKLKLNLRGKLNLPSHYICRCRFANFY